MSSGYRSGLIYAFLILSPLAARSAAAQDGCADPLKAQLHLKACRDLSAEGRCAPALEQCQAAASACGALVRPEEVASLQRRCAQARPQEAELGAPCRTGCAPGLACQAGRCAPLPRGREVVMEHLLSARALAMYSPCDGRQLLEVACATARHLQAPDLSEQVQRDLSASRRACPRYRGVTCGVAPPPSSPDGMESVLVPAGPYDRGSHQADIQEGLRTCRATFTAPERCDVQWFHRETPRRTLEVAAFYIDRTEVTNAQWGRCVAAGVCPRQDVKACSLYQRATGRWVKGGTPHPDLLRPDHPVVCVTWEEAEGYCRWAGKRLPTEAEWEKAARGTDGRQFPWGQTWNGAWLNWGERTGFASQDGWETTAPVGSFPQNQSPWGALDMAGNVWEWVRDFHSEGWYADSPERDPVNTTPAANRGMRGGAWSFAGNGARTTYRYFGDPASRDDAVGFRCAISAE